MHNLLLLLILAIVPYNSLFSGIDAYFKKPIGKSSQNKMRNIDFIYTLNLDKRPEKFALCLKQLNPYGIYPFRFSAVNGWELPLTVINDVGVKYQIGMKDDLMGTWYSFSENGMPTHEILHEPGRNYFCHCMARGPIAIVLSHLSILQDAYDSGYKTIWVMEDDIEVKRDPNLLSSMIEKLDKLVGKKGWDILFTDQDTKNKKGEYVPCRGYAKRPNYTPKHPERFAERKDISSDFRKIGARYGAYSMIVRRSGMKKILGFIKKYKIFLPYDMDMYMPDDIQMYAVKDDIVSTLIDALTDNGGPNYNKN